jgi:DMSO/TMAO reductase YedYZ molybdopterin-dependent catalytic subunit
VAAIPATSWLFDQVPSIDPQSWRLTVDSGGASRTWSLDQLARWHDRQTTVLDCTGGWWTQQEWSGVFVTRLLPEGATGSVEVTSATGYSRRLPLTPDLLLATGVGGQPLLRGHGSPARLVVPGRRGYHWVKWVVQISHDGRPWWTEPPLPLH